MAKEITTPRIAPTDMKESHEKSLRQTIPARKGVQMITHILREISSVTAAMVDATKIRYAITAVESMRSRHAQVNLRPRRTRGTTTITASS